MADGSRLEIIKANPIGKGLNAFRTSFESTSRGLAISGPGGPYNISGGNINLFGNLLVLSTAVNSGNFDIERIIPLRAVLNHEPDEVIWNNVYAIAASTAFTVAKPTTPLFANSTKNRKYVDGVLKEELGQLYVGVPGFFDAYFGSVAGLRLVAQAVFDKCKEGDNPLYREKSGWQGWPEGAREHDVLSWFAPLTGQLLDFVAENQPASRPRRRPLAQPHQPVQGSTADRKLGVGFVDDPSAGVDSKCYKASKAWLDLGRYAREVFAAQDSRRFVLGFTLCGSLMRLWEFDRLGGIASEQFDINEDGLQFLSAVLGFLWLNEERLGFDLDITKAKNYRPESSMPPPSTAGRRVSRIGRSSSVAGRKRSSSSTGALLPPTKRTCSSSPIKGGRAIANRMHRRVVVARDYGKPIYKSSSRTGLLAAQEGCIEGYESLHTRAGMLQCDISPNNLMMNEEDDNPSWRAFLIDLDLATKEQREKSSGARGKTGTRAFMAIGALLEDEEPHSFMHDLESFFWVLFWICIHYNGSQERVVPRFDKWNFADTEELTTMKLGIVSDDAIFHKTAQGYFTEYCQPLVPYANRLRRKVFPNGGRWRDSNPKLYSEMKEILRTAQDDLKELEI
ncbi:hypothetical protein CC78DRAFT_586283 [Lojkania enalia]|uniref:Fungal-type protein kinase domain-containing protein n=1 Tax=Lojkania enalia TaxID=147567 RepID=A0A9P4N1W1_9PLEO|nr:hypothetical protein CC78DRAFT_586283 [Didymosphaeria enalia]